MKKEVSPDEQIKEFSDTGTKKRVALWQWLVCLILFASLFSMVTLPILVLIIVLKSII